MTARTDPTTAELPSTSPPQRVGAFDAPPCPLTPDLRYEVATRRAEGHTWDMVGTALRYHPDALRKAADHDPDFAPALDKARAEELRDAEGHAVRRLRRLADSENDKVAAQAAAVLVRFGIQCRRDDARRAREREKAERAKEKAAREEPAGPPDAPPATEAPQVEPAEAAGKAGARKVWPRPVFDEKMLDRLDRLAEVTATKPPFRAVPEPMLGAVLAAVAQKAGATPPAG